MAIGPDGGSVVRVERNSVLKVLDDLTDHVDVDVDIVDGEFYWRCCRPDVLAALDALRERWAAVSDPPLEDEDRLRMRQVWREFRELWDRHGGNLPGGLDGSFVGRRIHLRGGFGTIVSTPTRDWRRWREDGSESRVELRVFSAGWTGSDVERSLREYLARPWITDADREEWAPKPPRPPDSVAVHVDFQLKESEEVGDPWAGLGRERFAAPHVVVSVGLPLPPKGTVAELYDGIVRGYKGWHHDLRGVPNRQQTAVAVRTWAVGLLVGSGCKVNVAIRDVCERMGAEEVTQHKFGRDRDLLVERVPEAER